MGEVFLGHDPRLRRNVAVKRLNGPQSAEHARSRILREARAAARLCHPNIASVYNVIADDDGAIIVMEYGWQPRAVLRCRGADDAAHSCGPRAPRPHGQAIRP